MDTRPTMLLSQILAGEAGEIPPVPIEGLAYDSRRVQPGYLFAAWAGARADGHAFVPQALKQGARCILAERAVLTQGVPCIVVPNVRGTLARAAQRFYGDPADKLKMVGVTGTNGKTTTVHLLESIFQAAGWQAGVIGTLGSRFNGRSVEGTLTTPESVDLLALLHTMVQAGVQAVAMEVSSQALAQERVSGLHFDVGIFTNFTQDHLDYHSSLDTYFAAKAVLVKQRLKRPGCAVLNLDDARVRTLQRPGAWGFSLQDAAEVRATALQLSSEGIDLTLQTPRGILPVHSALMGRFNVENVLAAATAALALGVEDRAVAQGIGALMRVPGRLERVSRPGEPLVLVDYAHTPDALQKALAALREFTPGQLFCVFGCGGDRDPHKRAPMGQAAWRGADWSVVTNDNPREEDPQSIADAVEKGMQSAGGVRHETPSARGYWLDLDRGAAIARALSHAKLGDTVLIAGKGHETYQLIGSTRHTFDDRTVARRCLDGLNLQEGQHA